MNTAVKTSSFMLLYGAILGVLSAIFSFMLYTMDMHYQGGSLVLLINFVILPIVLMSIGIYQFKRTNKNLVRFSEGLKIGVGISIIGGVIILIYNNILINFIDPDTIEKSINYARELLIDDGRLTSDQIELRLEAIRRSKELKSQIIGFFVVHILFGFLLSLIPAAILKRSED